MQISDEMFEAARKAYLDGGGDLRAALEAALWQQQGKKYSAADNLRNWAKAKATEDNDYLRADLLSNAACIEDLVGALKEIIGLADVDADNRSTISRTVLEKWGLR